MKLGIIGCGNMGGAILKGIAAQGVVRKRDILCSDKDKNKAAALGSRFKLTIARSNRQLARKCDLIILAVKPQDVDTVLGDIAFLMTDKLLISICAGITTKRLEQQLGRIAVVRVMPNMPALIGQGVSAICLGKFTLPKHRKLAVSIFSCIGEVLEVKERLMDAVTAISGSGPAYFFYLVERLIAAAKELGIADRVARRLAIKTALGSAMLLNQLDLSPQMLRRQVSSKGGTTEAAFKVLKNKGTEAILTQAFKAAVRRSKELQV